MADEKLEYISLDDALIRLGGNKALYKKLLGSFQQDMSFQQLCVYVGQGNYEGAVESAHALKGIAANLSLKVLYEKAAQIESELKQGGVAEESLDGLKRVLEMTLLQCRELENTL